MPAFLIPERLLKTVEGKIARFISSVPFCKVGFLAQARALYEVRTALRDVRLANIAALLSTYHARIEVLDVVGRSMQTLPKKTGTVTKPQLRIPAASWMMALTCYTEITGLSAMDIARGRKPMGSKARNQERGQKRAEGASVIDPVQRWLYDKLLLHEQKHSETYLRKRVQANAQIAERLRAIPRSTPQAQRWHLF